MRIAVSRREGNLSSRVTRLHRLEASAGRWTDSYAATCRITFRIKNLCRSPTLGQPRLSFSRPRIHPDLLHPSILAQLLCWMLLGASCAVAGTSVSGTDHKAPSYNDAAAVAANKGRTLNDEVLRGGVFAVGDAKYWDRQLDVSLKGRGDAFTNKKAQKYKTVP